MFALARGIVLRQLLLLLNASVNIIKKTERQCWFIIPAFTNAHSLRSLRTPKYDVCKMPLLQDGSPVQVPMFEPQLIPCRIFPYRSYTFQIGCNQCSWLHLFARVMVLTYSKINELLKRESYF